MMRVLLFSPLPPPAGGIATFTQQLLSGSAPTGVEWVLIDSAVTGRRRISPTCRRLWEECFRTVNLYRKMKSALRTGRIDLVHLNCALSPGGMLRDSLLVQQAKRWRVPVVLHCHRHLPDAAKGALTMWLIRQLCQKSDRVICLNRGSARFLQEHAGVQSVLLPNFLSDIPDTARPAISEHIHTAVYVGDVSSAKGCDTLLQAAKRLPHVRFQLVGPILEQRLCEQLPDNVVLTGSVDAETVRRALHSADLFVFASRSEGFPYAVLEAMAAALPIVASRVGAIPDMLGEHGVLFAPGDVLELIEAVEHLQDRELREQLGRAAWRRARGLYTRRAVLERLLQIYRMACTGQEGSDCLDISAEDCTGSSV